MDMTALTQLLRSPHQMVLISVDKQPEILNVLTLRTVPTDVKNGE